jgi:hypoxia up-regulated 1
LTPEYNETRKGLYLSIDGGKQIHTPEELTAMVLHYAEEITHQYGKEKGHTYGDITDCVLTVPSFSTQTERQALLDAAELGGFRVLGLIDENTASAVNFGMDKTFEEPQIYLFYNLGGSSLQVSIIKFHSYEVPESKYSKKMKRVGSIEVLGKGWDSTLGGLAYDNRLVEYMADHFNREWRHARGHDKDIRDAPRAMTKIRLQANKVKHVLSANQEIPVHIDSLHDDLSLSMHFTRTQFEELCDDLTKRATDPIIDALASANVTLEEITAIELIGGGMRVPKVQSSLSTVLGDMELGMHINSDESMALGASFYGANISTAFRVRQVGLVDISPFAVGVTLEDLEIDEEKKSSEDEDAWGKKATIFKANGKIGVKKTIAFTHDQDVHVSLDYSDPEKLPVGAKAELQRYKVSGVSAFAKEMEEKGLGKPKVSLQFELSQSGTTALIKAEAAVEETYTVEVEVEIDDDDEEETVASSNETSSSEDDKESKTGETSSSSEGESSETTTEEKSSPSEGESNETSTEDEKETENKTGGSAESQNDTSKEDISDKEEEPKKKKTKLVEKVCCLIPSLLFAVLIDIFTTSQHSHFLDFWCSQKNSKTCFHFKTTGKEKNPPKVT